MPHQDIPINMEELMKLAASPAGQQLLALLRQSNGKQLQLAAEKAAAGDLSGAKQVLSSVTQDPAVQELLSQLGK